MNGGYVLDYGLPAGFKPKEEVLKLLTHIQNDTRHYNETILQGTEYQRMFPEWSMGFREVNQPSIHIEFLSQPEHQFSLQEIARDPRTSYVYITSFRENGPDQKNFHPNRLL